MQLADLDKKLEKIEKRSCKVAAALVFIMIFPTTLDVLLRYTMDEPLPSMIQLTEFMMVGVVYLGISYVQSIKEHTKIEMATTWLPQRGQDFLDTFGYLVGLFIFLIITWQGARLAWDAWVTQDYTMGIIHFPLWPAKSVLPLGCGLLCVRLALDILLSIKKLKQPAINSDRR